MLYKKKALILVAIEDPYGTDATPTGANAIQVSDLKVEPAKGTAKKRSILTGDHSTQPHLITQQHQAVSFTLELKGGGAAGSVPECGPLLRACMMSETVDPGVDVAYQLVSAAFESVTIYVNMDGTLHKLIGFRGNVKSALNGGDYPTLAISGLALANVPADVAPVSPTFSTVEPVEVNNANTTFAYGGYAAVLHKLDIDPGVKTKYREKPNLSPEIAITGRDCKGTMVVDAVKVADHDFWANHRASAKSALSLVHGTVAGNIVEIAAPKVQLDTVNYGEEDDILTFNTPVTLTRDAGDDELVYTFR